LSSVPHSCYCLHSFLFVLASCLMLSSFLLSGFLVVGCASIEWFCDELWHFHLVR
jgi:hypothetical protein